MNSIQRSDELLNRPGPRLEVDLEPEDEAALDRVWAEIHASVATENANPEGHNQYTDNPAAPPVSYRLLSKEAKLKYKPWFDKHGQDARPGADGLPVPKTSAPTVAKPVATHPTKPDSIEAKTRDDFSPLEVDSTTDRMANKSGRGLPKLPSAAEASPKPGDMDAILRHVRGTGNNYATIGEVMEYTGFSHARTAHALAKLYHDRTVTLKSLEGRHSGGIDLKDATGQLSVGGEALGAVAIRH